MHRHGPCIAAAALLLSAWPSAAQPMSSKPATAATRAANAAVAQALPFADQRDFENARRGLIARPDTLTIRDAKGNVVWDLEAYKAFIKPGAPAPDTVNPSLWRNSQLNMEYGLYKVTDRIFQVRGYDLSNITFIQGDTGWIVFDPLISVEPAAAAYELVSQHLGKKPVVAIVYSHSHIDHYGGARALVSDADVKSGKVKVIAPEHFLEHAVSENVIAGNAMARRAIYMYGALLPRNAQGGVNGGLGQTTSTGTTSLIPPSVSIRRTGEELTIDGVRMQFQMTPGTEAPAEMNTYFPQMNALWMAENATHTLHNLYTLRGAQVRDALVWAGKLQETINLYGGQAAVSFASHHWPTWGNAEVNEHLAKQRDLYKYIHDQSVRMLNQGMTGGEIAEAISLPPELGNYWANRGYYGTIKHNARAVYQRYMGWYDANPANLDPHPPEAAAKKYVEYMGGADAVLKRAQADFDAGNYRWTAEVLSRVVFADTNNRAARMLLADSFEQMGYQAESGPWRSVYLQGAYELRNGVPTKGGAVTASPDTLANMTPEMLFQFLGVRTNGAKAAGKSARVNVRFTDDGSDYGLSLGNGVFNANDEPFATADAALELDRATLAAIQLRQTTLADAQKAGRVKLTGDPGAVGILFGALEPVDFWFNIVTP